MNNLLSVTQGSILTLSFLSLFSPAHANEADICPTSCTYSSIQNAINNSANGAELWVGPGTYNESVNVDRGIKLRSTDGAASTTIDATGTAVRTLYISAGTTVVDGFTITGGVDVDAAGVYLVTGTLMNSVVTGNSASGKGGGIFNVRGTVLDSVVENNTAHEGGGIYVSSTAMIDRVIVRNNQAPWGGGIYLAGSTYAVVNNSQVFANTSSKGAIYINSYAYPQISHVNVVGNFSAGIHAESYNSPIGYTTLESYIRNSILWGNSGSNLIDGSYNSIMVEHSIVGIPNTEGPYGSNGNISSDPLFVDAINGDYQLSASSPAIDMGMDSTILHDFAQTTRPQDGDGAGSVTADGSDYDLGAYEYVQPAPVISDPSTITFNYNSTAIISGDMSEFVTDTTVDQQGNLYIVGYVETSTVVDLDPSQGADEQSVPADNALFISKVNEAGVYQWGFMINTNDNVGKNYLVETDSNGNVYLAGGFRHTVDFDPGVGVDEKPFSGWLDIFVSKYDANGNYVSTWTIGGTEKDYIRALTVDAQNRVHVVGESEGTIDLDPSVGIDSQSSGSYLMSVNSDGSYVGSYHLPGTIYAKDVDSDVEGNLYVVGSFDGTVDFDSSAAEVFVTAEWRDGFLTRIDTLGNHSWTRIMTGTLEERMYDIEIDYAGNIYLAGQFRGTFVASELDPVRTNGSYDGVVVKYNSQGIYEWARNVGGSARDSVDSVTADAYGNVFIAGTFRSVVDFDWGDGVQQDSSNSRSLFYIRTTSTGDYLWGESYGDDLYNDFMAEVNFDHQGNLYISGGFFGGIDFDPGVGGEAYDYYLSESVVGASDGFVTKWNMVLP